MLLFFLFFSVVIGRRKTNTSVCILYYYTHRGLSCIIVMLCSVYTQNRMAGVYVYSSAANYYKRKKKQNKKKKQSLGVARRIQCYLKYSSFTPSPVRLGGPRDSFFPLTYFRSITYYMDLSSFVYICIRCIYTP